MKNLIIKLFLFLSFNVHAIETDKAAHLGISYALTTFTYGFLHKTVGMPVLASSIFAATIVTFGTLCKEGMSDSKMDMDDMKANGIGIGLSIGTVLLFNF